VRILKISIQLILKLLSIRVGVIASNSIGHLIDELELSIVHSYTPKKDIWFMNDTISNSTVWNQYKQEICVIGEGKSGSLFSRILLSSTRGNQRVTANFPVTEAKIGLLDSYPPILKVEPAQKMHTKKLLESENIDTQKPLVLLCVRDKIYTKNRSGQNVFDETSYRNSDISNCEEMIDQLIEMGYAVVRMGSEAKEWSYEKDNFWNYANSNFRSDETDVSLFDNCAFVVSTGTGVDELATAFRKRCYMFNLAPFIHARCSRLRPLYLPKSLAFHSSKKPLSLSQINDLDLGSVRMTSRYLEYGIDLIEAPPSTLRAFAREVHHFEASGKIPHESREVQEYFEEMISRACFGAKYATFIPKLSTLSLNYKIQ
jgi:putative glycosyltransferase (TIGR04372 family)